MGSGIEISLLLDNQRPVHLFKQWECGRADSPSTYVHNLSCCDRVGFNCRNSSRTECSLGHSRTTTTPACWVIGSKKCTWMRECCWSGALPSPGACWSILWRSFSGLGPVRLWRGRDRDSVPSAVSISEFLPTSQLTGGFHTWEKLVCRDKTLSWDKSSVRVEFYCDQVLKIEFDNSTYVLLDHSVKETRCIQTIINVATSWVRKVTIIIH